MFKKLFLPLFGLCAVLLGSCTYNFSYTLPTNPFKSGDAVIEGDDIDDSGEYKITVWCDQRIKDLTTLQINNFITASNGKYKIDFRVDTTGEDAAASSMIENVGAGADIYIFAQDQLSRLKTAGALSAFTGSIRDLVVKETSEDGVNAASLNGKLFALPFTSDNGYFMYYNKSVLNENDVKSMDSICSKLSSAGKKINFPVFSNGWYAASYFMATGCSSEWSIDPSTNKFSSYVDNYQEKGVDACKGLAKLKAYQNSIFTTKDVTEFRKSLGVLVSGIWDYELAAQYLGENLGCCEMPNFTAGDKTYHLSSYKGYKLIGVKPTNDSNKLSVCKRIARFLSNKSAQLERFDAVKWAPTNKEALATKDVQNHLGVGALIKQSTYAKPQTQTPSSWFGAVSLIAATLKEDGSNIASCLSDYTATLPSFLDD